jgi:hypothetical protein
MPKRVSTSKLSFVATFRNSPVEEAAADFLPTFREGSLASAE